MRHHGLLLLDHSNSHQQSLEAIMNMYVTDVLLNKSPNVPTLPKSTKSPVFHTKITLLSLQPYRPTGHCPNASMVSPPLPLEAVIPEDKLKSLLLPTAKGLCE